MLIVTASLFTVDLLLKITACLLASCLLELLVIVVAYFILLTLYLLLEVAADLLDIDLLLKVVICMLQERVSGLVGLTLWDLLRQRVAACCLTTEL